jgi:hypothetical protein
VVGTNLDLRFPLFNGESLAIEQSFEYNGDMQLADPTTDERDQRSPLDEALDDAEQALTTMISLLEGRQSGPAEQRADDQLMATLRNLPQQTAAG